MRRLTVVVLVLGVLALASGVSAQTVVINPMVVEFTASVDHNAVVPNSTPPVPLLTRYDLEIWAQAGTSALRVIAIGKPTPDAANQIVVTQATPLDLPTGAYLTYVVAVGPGGVGRSEPSEVWFAVRSAPLAPGKPLMRGESPPLPSASDGSLIAAALIGV